MTHPSLTFIARRKKFIASKFALCKLYDGYYRKILFANFMMATKVILCKFLLAATVRYFLQSL